MEARLAATLPLPGASGLPRATNPAVAAIETSLEAEALAVPLTKIDEAAILTAPSSDDNAPWPVDESAEVAFRAEAQGRGETVTAPAVAKETVAEEIEPKGPLPPLDQLVQRIPPEVRETLEDLFRAKFVSVKRVPKKALKG